MEEKKCSAVRVEKVEIIGKEWGGGRAGGEMSESDTLWLDARTRYVSNVSLALTWRRDTRWTDARQTVCLTHMEVATMMTRRGTLAVDTHTMPVRDVVAEAAATMIVDGAAEVVATISEEEAAVGAEVLCGQVHHHPVRFDLVTGL